MRFAVLALLFAAAPLAAQPGTLDPTFGTNGRAGSIASGNPLRLADLAVTAKGEAILLGAVDASVQRFGTVRRLTPDGLLDDAFSINAGGVLDIPGVYDIPTDLLIDDEDEIWIAGSAQPFPNEPGRVFVQRLLADGTPDPDFGGTNTTDALPPGLALYDLGADVRVGGLARLGGVLYVGVTERLGSRCGLAALTTDGALLDAPAPIVWVETEAACTAAAVAALPAGVVLAATATTDGAETVLAAGFTPSRAVWTGFGDGGSREVDFGEGADIARAAVAADGRYLIGGYAEKGNGALGALLLAFGADGQPDATFGDGGLVWRQSLPETRTESLGLDLQDGAATYGSAYGSFNVASGGAVTRLRPDGSADPAFGQAGVSDVASPGPTDRARYRGAYVALDPDGRTLVGGDYRPFGNSQMNLTAWRLQAATPTAGTATPSAPLALVVAPNPTVSAATLRLTLSAAAVVELAVYDVLGRRVATLHDGPAAAGELRASWDAGRVAPGAYTVRALVEGAVISRRVSVVR